jgi:hypothetical protein
MNKFCAIASMFGLALVLGSSRIWAAPLVQFPAGPAAWRIDVTASPKGDDDAPAAQSLGPNTVQKVEVTQNEHFARNLVTFGSGISRESWSITGTSLILTEDPNGTAFITPTTIFFNIPYLPSTFSWLSPSLLADKTAVFYQGKTCFHYKSSKAQAWVESKTLLPVAYDDGQHLAIFTFLPTPQEQLVLPDKFKKVLTNYTTIMGLHRAKTGGSE